MLHWILRKKFISHTESQGIGLSTWTAKATTHPSEDVFLEAVTDYQNELERCGYSYKMAYNPPAQPPAITGRRRGGRRVTWFNPPYSMDVATNVARDFLELVDKHFPPGNPLHSICNRSTLKVSYRCLPNMGSIIAKHNSKILRSANSQPKPKAHKESVGLFGYLWPHKLDYFGSLWPRK